METAELDENLNTIKAFHTFLTDIIYKGYNNEPEIIKLIVKHINNYVKDTTEDETEDETEEEEEEEEEEEDEETLLKQKIQSKIDKFLNSYNDLSKIYLYQKDNKYILELNNFIKSSLLY